MECTLNCNDSKIFVNVLQHEMWDEETSVLRLEKFKDLDRLLIFQLHKQMIT